MNYLIGVFMSASPFLMLGLVGAFITYVAMGYGKFRSAKFGLFIAGVGLIYGAIMPSNTYKVEAERLPNPVVRQYEKEIIANDAQIKKDEAKARSDRFEALVDWKSRYN